MVRHDFQINQQFTLVFLRDGEETYMRLLEIKAGNRIYLTRKSPVHVGQISSFLNPRFEAPQAIRIDDYELVRTGREIALRVPAWNEISADYQEFSKVARSFLVDGNLLISKD